MCNFPREITAKNGYSAAKFRHASKESNMKAAAGMVVTMHYTLTDDRGEVLDSSSGSDPLTYLHGAQNIIPGLERALEGTAAGHKAKVTVAPTEGYGEKDPA